MTEEERDYYTVSEAADLLRVSRPTVWRWINDGALTAYRVGARTIRVRRADLEAALRPARAGLEEQEDMDKQALQLGDPDRDLAALLAELKQDKQKLLRENGGRQYTPSAPLIREAREERHRRA